MVPPVTASQKPLRIGVIPGDGVGPEVIIEACKAIDVVADVTFTTLRWGSRHWHETGMMMPPDAINTVRGFDALLLGAVGDPSVPDHVSLWELLLTLRQELDLWANVRPVRLLPGVSCPLVGGTPETIDMLFIRENSEGEYAGVGGRAHRGLPSEIGLETAVFTRAAIARLVRYAFQEANRRRGRLTSATKSNASRYGYTLWDEVVNEIAEEFPHVETEHVLVDALTVRMVRNPGSLDVVVASNLFGDILTDLAGAIQGGLGMCASANVAPGLERPGIFEPVHGSAPDIAGQGVANPCGAIWSAALLLEHLEHPGGGAILRAVEDICATGPRTQDIGGSATTKDMGDAVAEKAALQIGG